MFHKSKDQSDGNRVGDLVAGSEKNNEEYEIYPSVPWFCFSSYTSPLFIPSKGLGHEKRRMGINHPRRCTTPFLHPLTTIIVISQLIFPNRKWYEDKMKWINEELNTITWIKIEKDYFGRVNKFRNLGSTISKNGITSHHINERWRRGINVLGFFFLWINP